MGYRYSEFQVQNRWTQVCRDSQWVVFGVTIKNLKLMNRLIIVFHLFGIDINLFFNKPAPDIDVASNEKKQNNN